MTEHSSYIQSLNISEKCQNRSRDLAFGEILIFLRKLEVKLRIFLKLIRKFQSIVEKSGIQKSEMKWAEWPLLNLYGLDKVQNEEAKSIFKILSSESIPSILYVIWRPHFEENMSLWSNDLLNQIIRGKDEAQDRKEEEEMKNSTSSVGVSRRRISVDFEISELFEDNLKMLWTALERGKLPSTLTKL